MPSKICYLWPFSFLFRKESWKFETKGCSDVTKMVAIFRLGFSLLKLSPMCIGRIFIAQFQVLLANRYRHSKIPKDFRIYIIKFGDDFRVRWVFSKNFPQGVRFGWNDDELWRFWFSCLSVCLFVCLYVPQSRRNYWRDRTHLPYLRVWVLRNGHRGVPFRIRRTGVGVKRDVET